MTLKDFYSIISVNINPTVKEHKEYTSLAKEAHGKIKGNRKLRSYIVDKINYGGDRVLQLMNFFNCLEPNEIKSILRSIYYNDLNKDFHKL